MKKIFGIIRKITILIIVIVMILMMSSMMFGNGKHSVFGYSGFIVLSDSMKATDFAAGDLIIIKKVEFTELKEGDIISYISQSSDNYMDIVTHKIRSHTVNELGEPGFITYGTTTGVDDEIVVTYPYILGKYQFHVAKVGIFLQFVKTVPGYIIFVAIPFLILIFMQVINTIKSFRRYKRVHINKLKMERQQMEMERKNLEKMIEELRILKSQDTIEKYNIDEKFK